MVARATTAAPKDFMSFNGYVDGGVKANNPCEFALSEIYQYYHDHRQSPPYFPIMVSVGTGIVPAQRLDSNFSLSFTGELKNVFTPKHLFDLLVYAVSCIQEVMSFPGYRIGPGEIKFAVIDVCSLFPTD